MGSSLSCPCNDNDTLEQINYKRRNVERHYFILTEDDFFTFAEEPTHYKNIHFKSSIF